MSNDRKKGPTLDMCCAFFHRRFIPPPTRHPQPFKHFVRQVPGSLWKTLRCFHKKWPSNFTKYCSFLLVFLSVTFPFFVPLPFFYCSFLWHVLFVALPFWCDIFFPLLFLSVTLPFCYSYSSFLLLFRPVSLPFCHFSFVLLMFLCNSPDHTYHISATWNQPSGTFIYTPKFYQ